MLDTRESGKILNKPSADSARLWQALSSFAGRVAQTDDPKEHQSAALRLQAELRKVVR